MVMSSIIRCRNGLMAGRVPMGARKRPWGFPMVEKPRDAPPAYATRHIENIRATVMQGA